MKSYYDSLKAQIYFRASLEQHQVPTKRVIDLSEKIIKWHTTLPVPDCWQPVALGRIAALFGVSREIAANALQHGNWKETRQAAHSLWLPPAENI